MMMRCFKTCSQDYYYNCIRVHPHHRQTRNDNKHKRLFAFSKD